MNSRWMTIALLLAAGLFAWRVCVPANARGAEGTPSTVAKAVEGDGQRVAQALATSFRLAIDSRSAMQSDPQRSLLLAVEAVEVARGTGRPIPPQVKEALIHALSATGGRVLRAPPVPASEPFTAPDPGDALPPAPKIEDPSAASEDLRDMAAYTRLVPVSDQFSPQAEPPLPPAPAAPDMETSQQERDRIGKDFDFTIGEDETPVVPPATSRECAEPIQWAPVANARLDELATDDAGRWVAACNRSTEFAGPMLAGPMHAGPAPFVYLWDLSAPGKDAEPTVFQVGQGRVPSLAIRADGAWLAVGGDDGRVHLWRLKGPLAPQPNLMLGPDGPSEAPAPAKLPAAPAPDANALPLPPESQDNAAVAAVTFTRDGRWLAAAWQNGCVRLWRMTGGGPADPPVALRNSPVPLEHPILQFSRDSNWLVVANADPGSQFLEGLGDALGGIFGAILGDDSDQARADREAEQARLELAARCLQLYRLNEQDPGKDLSEIALDADPVCRVAFSPDSQRLAACSTEGMIHVWTLGEGGIEGEPRLFEQAGQYFLGGVSVQALAFDPSGRWLVSAGMHDVRLWDCDGEPDNRQPAAVVGRIGAAELLACDPRGEWFAFGSTAGPEISFYDFVMLRALMSDECETIVVEPGLGYYEGDTIAGGITVEPGGEPGARVLRGHSDSIMSLLASDDGSRLLTGSSDGTVRVWDANRLSPFVQPRCLPALSTALNVALPPDGKVNAVSTYLPDESAGGGEPRGIVTIWPVPSREFDEPLASLPVNGDLEWVVGVSDSRRWAITETLDAVVHLWDLKADDVPSAVRELGGLENGVGAFAFSPDGRWLVTAASAHFAVPPPELGEGEAGEPMGPVEPMGPPVADPTVRVWNLNTATGEAITLRGHARSVNAILISPDSRWCVTASSNVDAAPPPAPSSEFAEEDDNSLCLWNLRESRADATPTVLLGPRDVLQVVQLSPDGRYLVAAEGEGMIHVWDLTSAQPRETEIKFRGHERAVRTVSFSANGKTLATGSGTRFPDPFDTHDGTVRLWDLTRPDMATTSVELAGHHGSINGIAISTDGRWVATADSGAGPASMGRARLWDLRAKNPQAGGVVLRAHDDTSIEHVAISPDSRWLVSVGMGKVPLMLWDLRTSDPTLSAVALCPHRQPVDFFGEWITFTPDSRAVQTVGIQGVYTWLLDVDELLELARKTAGRSLTVEERRRHFLPARQ